MGENQKGGREFLAFLVGGHDYAVDISAVREIRGWTEPAAMPNAAAHVLGVINLRGEILPLLDLAAKLGLATPDISARSVIVVCEFQSVVLGVLIDAVSDIIAPTDKDMQPPPEAATNGEDSFVAALTMVDDKIIRILDGSAVFKGAEVMLAEAS